MARHYSTTNFSRQMPNALLARYFKGKGLLADLDFAAMSETKPDGLLAAWLALPNDPGIGPVTPRLYIRIGAHTARAAPASTWCLPVRVWRGGDKDGTRPPGVASANAELGSGS